MKVEGENEENPNLYQYVGRQIDKFPLNRCTKIAWDSKILKYYIPIVYVTPSSLDPNTWKVKQNAYLI